VIWKREDIHCDHLEGPGSSPTIFEDLLIFHMDGADVQYLLALDKETGETVWKTDRSRPLESFPPDLRKAYSTPVVASVGDRLELVSSGAQHTFGYDPRTGEELWHADVPGFSMSARPALGHGMVYLNSGFGKARLIALELGGAGEVTDRIAWEFDKGVPTMSSHLLVGDHVYLVSDGGVLTCLDAKSGGERWRERLEGGYCASPVLSDGRIYFANRDGLTTVLRADGEFEILAKNSLEEGCMASPIALGDALFLRTTSHLYRIESSAPAGEDS
jgi:outer membrane protein assembly factor BamB